VAGKEDWLVIPRALAPSVLSVLIVLIGAAVCALPVHADAEATRFAALLRDTAPAFVTVKVVTKTSMQMGGKSADQESRVEVPGVVVDAGGLIMASIVPFAPERLMKLFARGAAEKMPQLKTVPNDIEVLFEQDEKEHRAFLAATDSNLGVVFLQLEEPEGLKLRAIDFSHPAGAALGDLVVAVSRLGKEYDSTAYFETTRISGEITKPRKAWVIDHGLPTLGLPIFSPAGGVLGVLAIVDPGLAEADSSTDTSFSMAMSMLTGGGGVRFFVVPAPAVAAVIDQARQQAAQKAAERAAAKKAAPRPSPPSPPSPPGRP
jgi:hypothetical protein